MRRLVFGDEESGFKAFIGAYLGVLTLPKVSDLDGELLVHVGVGRTAGMYGARHLGDARALFLFRSERELDYHHRDVPRQKELLRGAFAGMHPDVDRWLHELDRTPAFYFDSITQLRMNTWSRGRVTLVGDATKSARLYNSMAVDDYPPSPTASRGRVGLAGGFGGGLGAE